MNTEPSRFSCLEINILKVVCKETEIGYKSLISAAVYI